MPTLSDVRLFPVHNERDAGVRVIANVVHKDGTPRATLGSASLTNPEEMKTLQQILHAYYMAKKLAEDDQNGTK